MFLSLWTLIFLFFLFLTYALFLMGSRKADARQARLQQRVAEALQENSELTLEQTIQITRDDSISSNPTLNRLLSPLNFVKRLDNLLQQADLQITVSRLLTFCLIAGVMAGLASYTVMNVALALVVALVAASLPLLHVSRVRKKRLLKFNEQLPDTLDLLSRSLQVGHAFSESLHQVASEMPEPIASEFRITFEEQKLGLSTKAALDRLSERVPLSDLHLCITAIHIQRKTGGNLAEILEKVAQTIRERFKLMEDFRTMTTSARGSAWILCGLPFVIVFVMTFINPKYMSPLLYDRRGHFVILCAAILMLLGILTIKRILNIKV
jgi:tight adherence protein B